MKKVKSYETLTFNMPNPEQLKQPTQKLKINQSPSPSPTGIKANKSKLYRSKTKLFKQIESRYEELKDEWTVVVEEAKHR